MLRSLRFGEADRVLHLYTAERGRVNAIAKGVRKTTSRFGGRLEPLTRAQLLLHEGRGELHTVSGADIVASHAAVRERRTPWAVAQIGAEAVLKLHPRAGAAPSGVRRPRPVPRPPGGRHRRRPGSGPRRVGLGFQLKLLAPRRLPAAPRRRARRAAPSGRWSATRRRRAAPCADAALSRPGRSGCARGASSRSTALVERPLHAGRARPEPRRRTPCGWSRRPTSTTAASACAPCTREPGPAGLALIACASDGGAPSRG